MHDCPICERADRKLDEIIWRVGRVGKELESAAHQASEHAGTLISAACVNKHLKYHEAWQPPPLGYLNRRQALIDTDNLSAKLQLALRIVWRQGAVSEWQLRELLWPSHQYANDNTARAACYRDLARLVEGDWLYRAWPAQGKTRKRAGASQRRREAVLFLGRTATAWIFREHGVEVRATTGTDKIDWNDVDRRLEANDVFVNLATKLQEGARVADRHAVISLDLTNWFGSNDTQLWFRAAGLQSFDRRVRPAGFAIARLETADSDHLLPFFYALDFPHESAARAATRHLAWFGAVHVHAPGQRFPALGMDAPPILLVTGSASRSHDIAREMARQARQLTSYQPPALMLCDHEGIAKGGWQQPICRLAWDADASTAARTIGEVLLAANRRRITEDPLIPGTILVPNMTGAARMRT